MIPQFDEKGKIFTNVIAKKPIIVTIQTTTQKIHGELYVRPGERLKDELNNGEQLIAVTNVIVSDEQGHEVYRCNFLLLNRSQIIWLIPDEDLVINNQTH